jgi:hypothetical protein
LFFVWSFVCVWLGVGCGGGSGGGSGGWSDSVSGWRCNWEFVEKKWIGDPRSFCNLAVIGSPNMVINPTGTKLYLYCEPNLLEFILNPAYDLSSISFFQKFNLKLLLSVIYGHDWGIDQLLYFYFRQDGKMLYVSNYNDIFQFELSTPWDVSTIEYVGKYITFNEDSKYLHTICLSFDGSKLYIKNVNTGKFYQCSLSTPWDITTISSIEEIPTLSTVSQWFQFRPDGRALYSHIVGGYVVYNLTTPWDARTAIPSSDCIFYNLGSGLLYKPCMCLSYDGLYYFVLADQTTEIYKFAIKD